MGRFTIAMEGSCSEDTGVFQLNAEGDLNGVVISASISGVYEDENFTDAGVSIALYDATDGDDNFVTYSSAEVSSTDAATVEDASSELEPVDVGSDGSLLAAFYEYVGERYVRGGRWGGRE